MPDSIINYILDTRWAITPAALSAIIDIVQRNAINIDPKIFHHNADPESLFKDGGLRRDVGSSRMLIRDRVAVIGIHGPIFPRADLFTEMSEAESISTLSKDFNKALEDPRIHSIIFDIDSPGGLVTETDAFSQMIFEGQATKPIISVITGAGASGAFWIGSSASEVIAARTSVVGSIGVIAAIRDESKKDEKEGIQQINIISSVSPKKRPDLKTKEGRKGVQKIVDDLGNMFVESIARNRGTTFEDVVENFGKGDVLIAQDALEAGMIDGIDSLEAIIDRQNKKANSTTTTGGNNMPDRLVKEATSQDVKSENPGLYNAIIEEGKKEALGSIETTKAEAFNEGVKAENQRIQDIESLDSADTHDIVTENKFNSEMSKEKVSVLIVEDQKAKTKKAAEDHAADAGDVDTVDGSSPTGDDAKAATVGNMVAGANANREAKKRKN